MKVLLVGLGGIGQRHVRNLRRVCGPDLEVTAVRTRGLARVVTDRLEVVPDADLHATYGIRAVADLDRALAEAPDAVLVCNPTSLHMPVALAAARVGRDLFIEKPLSDRWEGVEELVELVDRQGLAGMVGCQMRFHPCLTRLRELLADRVVGRIISVHVLVGSYLPAWHQYEDYRELYAGRRDLGGGVVLTQIHELDYVTWLFGPPSRVFALGGRLGDLEIDVEDTASLLLECTVEGRLVPVHVHQDYRSRPPLRTCEVIGEDGRIEVDLGEARLRVLDCRGRVTAESAFEAFDRNEMFVDEMTRFLACVRREATPHVSVADGARSLRLALAARESMDTGAMVTLP